MAFRAIWHEKAFDDLGSLDRPTARKIVDRVKNYLSQDPENLGKPLKGVLQGLSRYRWGDYRIIYSIDRAENSISILHIGHRRLIYK